MSEDRVKVLIADDGKDNREFIVDYILKPNGFEPIVARDGVEAMQLIKQDRPDIILLDLQMPRMNGMEVLDALQAEGMDIPVILMTFHGSEEVAVEVYRKGVRDYVRKPYTVDEMMDAMNRCLGEVRLRQEKEALTNRLLRANATLTRRVKELNTLYTIGKNVTELMSMDMLLPRVVDAATQVVEAEQGALYLIEGDQLVCRAIKAHAETNAISCNDFSTDRIAKRAATTGQPVVFSPEELERHRAKDPSLPTAIASIPLKMKDRVVGILSVSSVSASARPFTKQDGTMLSALGDYAAVAIENARIYAELEEASTQQSEIVRAAFERYVAPSVVERVLQNPDALQLGGTRREISVVFADVRGFTSYSEQAAPEDVVASLNQYLSVATEVIFSREGTLDKFQGDAVIAIFNAPEDQDDHVWRAADAALALQRAITERNARGGDLGMGFGVGVHVGDAVVGNIGTDKAMNFTAIGDTVNVAQRLQEHADAGQVLITAEVRARLGDKIEVNPVGDVEIRGRSQQVEAFELVALG